jgi:geranylgeranyl reductase family protein
MLEQPRVSAADASSVWDAVIVGAGPAGATAAIQLGRCGHRVLLLDRDRFPRDKVCGDALIPDAWRCLERLDLLENVRRAAREVSGASVFSPSRRRVDIDGAFLTLKRIDFDAILVDEAVRSGAVLRQAHVERVSPSQGAAVTVTCREQATISARLALLATGADVLLPSRLGVVTRSEPTAIALRCYVRSPARVDRLIISYDRAIIPGYAWIFPLADGEYNIGCGVFFDGPQSRVNLRRLLRAFMDSFPAARDIMNAAVAATPPKGARLRCGLTGTHPRPAANVLVIGEAAGTTFPFTGEGIGKAMETGIIAAEVGGRALETGDTDALDEYDCRLRDELKPRYRGYEVAQRWLSVPWLNDFVASRATKSRFLQNALTGILNETANPSVVCSISGVLRSLVT